MLLKFTAHILPQVPGPGATKRKQQLSFHFNIPENIALKHGLYCRYVITVLGFLLLLQSARAQYDWSELDASLEQQKQLLGKNLVAMVWKGDSLVFKKEIGDFTAKTKAPIASCSKWLTAALVLQFVDEGKISLDDYVVKYIPEFEKYFKKYITIRQCLSHTTGITDDDKFLRRILQRRKYNSLEEEVNDFAAREIRSNPGTDFWYGNVGLNIVARILEVVSKRKFDVLIKTKLFNPLGMRNTSFSTLDGSAVNPSGGAISTPEDYMRFLVMLLNKGKYNGVQILSENAVAEMLKVQTRQEMVKFTPQAAKGFNYASGCWVLEEKNGSGTVVASPGLFGTWPMIDYCRGYAYLVFVKNLLGEERADAQLGLKKAVDSQIPAVCR